VSDTNELVDETVTTEPSGITVVDVQGNHQNYPTATAFSLDRDGVLHITNGTIIETPGYEDVYEYVAVYASGYWLYWYDPQEAL
jgi:hypothetical protein